jgi:oligoendopeptidase F
MLDSGNRGYTAQGVVWDLKDLYSGVDDSGIEKDLITARERARDFVASCKGKLHQRPLNSEFLLSALRDYESIHEMGMRPRLFAYLYHSADREDHERSQLLQKVEEEWNTISRIIAFFELEIMALPDDLLRELAAYQGLRDYGHFFSCQNQWKPFRLSKAEEDIIKQKELSGKRAFISLFDRIMQSISCKPILDGKEQNVTADEALALLHSPNRMMREKAFHAFLKELQRRGMLFTHILNALTLDSHLENMNRGHHDPMHRMHLTNGVDGTVVQRMMASVEGHYELARRYFRLKAQLLGIGTLKFTDLYAPLEKEAFLVSFSDARRLVLEAVEDLHPLWRSVARELFEKKRIDAEVRRGKQSGSFCKCLSPSEAPYISLNFRGTIRDLMELAHELGHGMHYRLSSGQSFLNFRIPPIFAETASTFFEIHLSRHLMEKEDFLVYHKAIAACRVDRILLTVFRQNVLTRFEQRLHNLRRNGLISEEKICGIWWDENRRLCGDDLHMPSGYRWGWAYIPHLVHRPFYCYSYIFGNLLSLILHEDYLEQGEGSFEKIIQLLNSGSSKAPMELLTEIGLNPGEEAFWERAFHYVARWIEWLDVHEEAET